MSKISYQLNKWTGDFGKEYTDRNTMSVYELNDMYKRYYGITKTALNNLFLKDISHSARILEVGCNTGNQLLCLQKMGFKNLYGIEPQEYAVELARKRTKGITIIKADAFDIPFKDSYFDLVFTTGVLIHVDPKRIKDALKEIHRCTIKYISGLEYYSDKYEEIAYRGKKGLLWKTDFCGLYLDSFRDLRLLKEKRLKYLDNDNVDKMFLLRKT